MVFQVTGSFLFLPFSLITPSSLDQLSGSCREGSYLLVFVSCKMPNPCLPVGIDQAMVRQV